MITSKQGRDFIKKWEGLRLETYLCAAGVPTIGWGTTRMLDGKPPRKGQKITVEQAEELLTKDLRQFEDCVRDNVIVPLTQNQFDALVSLCYNIGTGNFLKSTLLRLLNQGRFKDCQAQFLRWNRAGGKVLKGLTRRRLGEAVIWGGMSAAEMVAIYKLEV